MVNNRNKTGTHLIRVCYLFYSLGKGLWNHSWKTAFPNTVCHICFFFFLSLLVFFLLLFYFILFFNLQKWFHKIFKSGAVISVPRVRAFPSTGEGSIFIYFLFPGALWPPPPDSKQKGNVLFSSEPQMFLILFFSRTYSNLPFQPI